jgi:FkbM family methyltransferase
MCRPIMVSNFMSPTGARMRGGAADEVRFSFQPESVRDRCLTAAARHLHHRSQLWRTNFSVSGRLAGRALRVPFIFGAGWEHLRMREVWLFHGIERLFTECTGAFLDVGVNVGHTLIKVKIADPDREYFGFEPNPNCLQYLEYLIKLNGFRRCTIVPVGLSDRSGVVKLLLNPDVDPSATIVEGYREPHRYARSMLVPVFTGDELLQALGTPDVAVVKIDVEGAEVGVLQGLTGTLRRCEPLVFCEVLPVFDPSSDVGRFRVARQLELREMLVDLDYFIYRVHADETLAEVGDFGLHSDLSLVNYIFVPRRRLNLLSRRFTVSQPKIRHTAARRQLDLPHGDK